MLLSELDFHLPDHLIAYEPAEKRGEDRLLCLDKNNGKFSDHKFSELPELLPAEALLIFNDSKVHKARLLGKSETGANVEFLLIRELQTNEWLCMVEKSKRQKPGKVYQFPKDISGQILKNEADGLKIVRFSEMNMDYLENHGEIPLPPYIKRKAVPEDNQRYQTVYARVTGSAAAPTAGLHFTAEMMQTLTSKGFESAFVTLHVGLGTFAPIRTERVEDHKMHSEYYHIDEKTACQINKALEEKRPVIPIGTTACRTIESAFDLDARQIKSGSRDTQIFIYPGYQFRTTAGLLTNFHTPGSTLLAMVSALAGSENIKRSYQHAVEQQYRFFSYGDAMLIL